MKTIIKKIKSNQLTVIDLFAGCGGLSLGLEKAGFIPIYVNELNKDAIETYLKNRDEEYPYLREKYFSNDIKEIVSKKNFFNWFFENLKRDFGRDFKKDKVDLVVGGPPCQGFSGIGHRRSFSVEKSQLPTNHLYQDMAYFIHKIQPKIFLFENVEGLLSARWTKEGERGEIFEDVLSTFRRIKNYEVRFKLIHAKDYGVPQNRPRILIVGIRKNLILKKKKMLNTVLDGFLPEPKFDYPNIEDVLSDLIDKKFIYGSETFSYPNNPQNSYQKELRKNPRTNRILGKNTLSEHEYSKHSEKVIERFQFMIKNNGKIPEHLKTKKFAQRVLPKKWGEKGPSITACSLPDDFVHYSQARSLTVREWARLQTFPDWYQFSGKRTTGGLRRAGNPRESIFEREVPKYTQIGNAVPVKLAYELGKHFSVILND